MPETTENKFYDTAQAAVYIGYSKSSLENWRITHEGPAYYKFAGRRIRYKKTDLDAYIEKGRVEPSRVETREPRA